MYNICSPAETDYSSVYENLLRMKSSRRDKIIFIKPLRWICELYSINFGLGSRFMEI